jgi:Tfp pilus assembly protein FimV
MAGTGSPPRAPGGVVIARDNWAAQQGTPAPPAVEVFDLEVYIARPGDTLASISQARFQSEKYEQALALFNRERNPQFDTPRPGRYVYIPPVDYLERRFRHVIPGQPASPGPASPAGSPAARAVTSNQPGGARQASFPQGPSSGVVTAGGSLPGRPAPMPGQDASLKALAGGKRYQVRPNDTVWTIAKRTLGTGERWPDILRLNREVLRDVNQLQVGMILRLPDDAQVDSPDLPR